MQAHVARAQNHGGSPSPSLSVAGPCPTLGALSLSVPVSHACPLPPCVAVSLCLSLPPPLALSQQGHSGQDGLRPLLLHPLRSVPTAKDAPLLGFLVQLLYCDISEVHRSQSTGPHGAGTLPIGQSRAASGAWGHQARNRSPPAYPSSLGDTAHSSVT